MSERKESEQRALDAQRQEHQEREQRAREELELQDRQRQHREQEDGARRALEKREELEQRAREERELQERQREQRKQKAQCALFESAAAGMGDGAGGGMVGVGAGPVDCGREGHGGDCDTRAAAALIVRDPGVSLADVKPAALIEELGGLKQHLHEVTGQLLEQYQMRMDLGEENEYLAEEIEYLAENQASSQYFKVDKDGKLVDDSDDEDARLGAGSFGYTFRMKNRLDHRVRAVKIVDVDRAKWQGVMLEDVEQEAKSLSQIQLTLSNMIFASTTELQKIQRKDSGWSWSWGMEARSSSILTSPPQSAMSRCGPHK